MLELIDLPMYPTEAEQFAFLGGEPDGVGVFAGRDRQGRWAPVGGPARRKVRDGASFQRPHGWIGGRGDRRGPGSGVEGVGHLLLHINGPPRLGAWGGPGSVTKGELDGDGARRVR